MFKLKKALLGSAVMIAASLASADVYVGGSYSILDFEEEGIPDLDFGALNLRGGVEFNDYISAELRYGFGVKDDSVGVVDFELERSFGLYLRGGAEVANGVKPYAMIGYTDLEISASGPGGSADESSSDLGFGIGVDIDVAKDLVFNLEYANFYNKDDTEVSGFSLGFVAKF